MGKRPAAATARCSSPTGCSSYCHRAHAVSTQRETANTLIEIDNYPPVSPFHDFGEWAIGNLNLRLRRFLAQFKLHSVFPQNRETAKQWPVSFANTGTYLFHAL
jgi:hypothetical protein